MTMLAIAWACGLFYTVLVAYAHRLRRGAELDAWENRRRLKIEVSQMMIRVRRLDDDKGRIPAMARAQLETELFRLCHDVRLLGYSMLGRLYSEARLNVMLPPEDE